MRLVRSHPSFFCPSADTPLLAGPPPAKKNGIELTPILNARRPTDRNSCTIYYIYRQPSNPYHSYSIINFGEKGVTKNLVIGVPAPIGGRSDHHIGPRPAIPGTPGIPGMQKNGNASAYFFETYCTPNFGGPVGGRFGGRNPGSPDSGVRSGVGIRGPGIRGSGSGVPDSGVPDSGVGFGGPGFGGPGFGGRIRGSDSGGQKSAKKVKKVTFLEFVKKPAVGGGFRGGPQKVTFLTFFEFFGRRVKI